MLTLVVAARPGRSANRYAHAYTQTIISITHTHQTEDTYIENESAGSRGEHTLAVLSVLLVSVAIASSYSSVLDSPNRYPYDSPRARSTRSVGGLSTKRVLALAVRPC